MRSRSTTITAAPTRAERAEDALWLLDNGVHPSHFADRLGISIGALAYILSAEDLAKEAKMLEEAGGWNFLAASPVGFLGPDNGIPYHEVQYLIIQI